MLNSKDLVKEFSGSFIDDDQILNSHNVVSLFTNTPKQDSLCIIKQKTYRRCHAKKKRTDLSDSDIIELLDFILSTTYFSFGGIIYKQRFGAAMGSLVSPTVANLFMENLEQEALPQP